MAGSQRQIPGRQYRAAPPNSCLQEFSAGDDVFDPHPSELP